ncbi:MAG: GerMN domain-containing protein [Candidatus Paceibacterota bacterium]
MKSEYTLKFLITLLVLVLALLGYVLLASVFNYSPFGYEGPLTKWQTAPVKVYWSKASGQDCTKVEATERQVSVSVHRAKAAVQAIIDGPNAQEKELGYFSNLATTTRLNSLTINNSRAYADFDEALDYGVAGSCRVIAIRSQIAATLEQFPTIKEVVISVNGRTAEILQP